MFVKKKIIRKMFPKLAAIIVTKYLAKMEQYKQKRSLKSLFIM